MVYFDPRKLITEYTNTSGLGMLDIHEHSGQLTLKAAGLFDKFLEIIHPCGQGRALDKDGNVLLDHPDDGTGGRLEVPREELRRILLESLPKDTVRRGHKVTSASLIEGGRHVLAFADGSAVTTELLVGADGAWSRVRSLSKAKVLPNLLDDNGRLWGQIFVLAEPHIHDVGLQANRNC